MRLLNSVLNFKSVANDTIDKLSTIAGGALCLPSLLTTALLSPASVLTGIKNNVLQTAKQQIGQLKGLVQQQISGIISKVTGRITGALKQVQNLINDIGSLVKTFDDLKKTLGKRSLDIINFTAKKQNCQALAANLSKCVTASVGNAFNRSLQAEFSKTNSLDIIADKVIQKISVGENIFGGYVDKYSRQLDKATTQMSAINNTATNFTYLNLEGNK